MRRIINTGPGSIRTVLAILVACLGYSIIVQTAWSQPILDVRIADVIADPGDENVQVDIYFSNYTDTVGGFLFVLESSRPDLISFSEGMFPPGPFLAEWDYLTAYWLNGPEDIEIHGIADFSFQPGERYITPQAGGEPLFTLHISVSDTADTLAGQTETIRFSRQPGHFIIWDNHNQPIGCAGDTIVADTTCFRCAIWAPPPDDTVCLYWDVVDEPPCDSIFVWIDTVPYLDTNLVLIQDGSLMVPPFPCGDIDGFDYFVDISDLTRMIDYLFISYEPLVIYYLGNVDGSPDGVIDTSDLTRLIEYLFINGQELEC